MFSFGSLRWPGLAKLVEECGEVVRVVGKLMNTNGEPKHWSGLDLRAALEDEIGDLHAAIGFAIERCGLDVAKISKRSTMKRALFERWHKEQAAKPVEVEGAET